jgi:hypothetical protein
MDKLDTQAAQRASSVSLAPLRPLSDLELSPRLPAWFTLNTLLQVLGAVLGLGGQYLINERNALGFVMWLGANAALAWLQLRMRLFILTALHVTYFALCVHGLLNWSR